MWYFLSAVLLLLFTWFTLKPKQQQKERAFESHVEQKNYGWKKILQSRNCRMLFRTLHTEQPKTRNEMREKSKKKFKLYFRLFLAKQNKINYSQWSSFLYVWFFLGSSLTKKFSPFIFKTLKFKHLFIHTIIIQTFFFILSFYSNFTHLQNIFLFYLFFLFFIFTHIYINFLQLSKLMCVKWYKNYKTLKKTFHFHMKFMTEKPF